MTSLHDALRQQARWCEQLGSPFTVRLMHALCAAPAQRLPPWEGDAVADAVPLRLAAALHALVLRHQDAALAALWPSAATSDEVSVAPPDAVSALDGEALDAAVADALQRHRAHVHAWLQHAPQTNEVGRSAVLLGGYAWLARRHGLPLATLEIGASAGLNGLWPWLRFELGDGRAWGDAAASPVTVRSQWRGAAPSLPTRIERVSHAACDIAPVDLAEPGADLRLLSYVWPDQHERLARLRAALALARRHPVAVEAADAGSWVENRLAAPRPGSTTVLVHSIVWPYLGAAAQQRIADALAAAGARASATAPLAWLRLESPASDRPPRLVVTDWPGGESCVLAARAHPHGHDVDWS